MLLQPDLKLYTFFGLFHLLSSSLLHSNHPIWGVQTVIVFFLLMGEEAGGVGQEKLAVLESRRTDSSSPAKSSWQKLHSGLCLAVGRPIDQSICGAINTFRVIRPGAGQNNKVSATTPSEVSLEARRISWNSLRSLEERWNSASPIGILERRKGTESQPGFNQEKEAPAASLSLIGFAW